MKRAIKRLLFLAVFMLTFGLVGCGSTLTTNLSISDNFAGSRTMDVSIDKETFDEYAPAGGFKTLALETAENTPECMEFSYEEKGGKYIFHFVMSFTSQSEYEKQVSTVLGKEQEIEFTYSKSPFSGGISLQEDFSSEDLLDWFKDYLVGTKYVEEEDAPYVFKKVKNVIQINGTKYDCVKNRLSVSKKSYIAIKQINIFTDLDIDNEKIARKIELIFDDYVLEANREVIEGYLKSVTPSGCVGEWQKLDDYEKFILIIPTCTEEEMTQVMQIFCGSDKSRVDLLFAGEKDPKEEEQEAEEISYSDMWDEEILGSIKEQNRVNSEQYVQPFGFESTIEEALDLGTFVCNSWGEIESSYYISSKNGKPKSMIYYPNNKESYGWDYIDSEYPDYYYIESTGIPVYQVISEVNKYYVPDNIKMNTRVKSADKIVREFVFEFDEAFDKSAVKKIEDKMDSLFEEHKDLIKVSVKNRKNKSNIIWKISGDTDEVDTLCKEIFGMGYSEISYYCQDRVVMNRQYDYKEIIDFRPIFDWEYDGNIDYTLKMTGKVNKESSMISGGLGAPASVSGSKVNYLSTESGYFDARVVGTTVHKVLLYIIFVLVLNVVKTAFAVLVYRRNKRVVKRPSRTNRHPNQKKKKSHK